MFCSAREAAFLKSDTMKDYLEAELGSQVVYHTWFPGVSFENSNLLEEMQAREYFYDSKVKTILLPYASQFSL